MCTLTVFPYAGGTIVTMNRDEADSRAEAGEHLQVDGRGDLQQWWPIDSVSQGTWFGARGDGLVGALLNRYQGTSAPPRRSRGLIIPAVLADAPIEGLASFITDQDWNDFAPFDLVLVQGARIVQCSWESSKMEVHKASADQPFFLSSSSVEFEASLRIRRENFASFIASQQINPSTVIELLHLQAHPANASLGFRMLRPGRRTKSISQAVVGSGAVQQRYIPLPS